MPRKSLDAQSVVSIVPPAKPPAAPKHLTAEEAEVWETVTKSKSADWFTPENYPILEAYCNQVVVSRKLAALISTRGVDGELDRETNRLITQKLAVDRTLTMLATRMRLTQQSRWQSTQANAKSKMTSTNVKPWESKEQ